METQNQPNFHKDLQSKKITFTRHFDAPPDKVWNAWTQRELLEQWWAPRPWKAESKKMDFREGGEWLYAMVGPENQKHWAKVNFLAIREGQSFEALDTFTDENGNPDSAQPSTRWKNTFTPDGTGTLVTSELQFATEDDLHKILAMGFQEGMTMTLGHLDELLSK